MTLTLPTTVIVVAAPLRESNTILQELAQRTLPGVVFDVGSLKGPVRQGLLALAQSGARVTSIHPMFGPDTELLSGRHVIFVDVGVPGRHGHRARAVQLDHGRAGTTWTSKAMTD